MSGQFRYSHASYGASVADMVVHLFARGIDQTRMPGVHVARDCATFTLWNLSGQMVGYQTYTPRAPKARQNVPREQRYFTHLSRHGGKHVALAVWGIDAFRPGQVLFTSEGVFDAAHIRRHGYAAVATLGNAPDQLKSWLLSLGVRIVAVCDGDDAGSKLARYAHDSIHMPEGIDPDDMPPERLAALLREAYDRNINC